MPYYGTGRKPTIAPERQRKLDLIAAAVAGRGLTLSDYRAFYYGSLGWTVNLHAQPGAHGPEYLGDIGREDFDELVALFADDLLWAKHTYAKGAQGMLREYSAAEYALTHAKDGYGRAATGALLTELEGDLAKSERHYKEEVGWEARVRTAHAAWRRAVAALDTYHAAQPADLAAARAYLATVPTYAEREAANLARSEGTAGTE